MKSIKRKNKSYKKYLAIPSLANENFHKKYKNKLNYSLHIAKRLYFEQKLEYAKMNIKSIWKILNEVINRKRRCNKLLSIFTIENQDVSDSEVIANRFCDYFSNIGPNLAKKVPASSCSICFFLTGNFMNSFFFEPTTQPEIVKIMKSLRSGTAAGFDNIST